MIQKSPHDAAAMLVMLAGIFIGCFFLKRFRLGQLDTERDALRAKGLDLFGMGALFGVAVAFYFAPQYPLFAIAGATGGVAVCGYRLLRHHAGMNYSPVRRTVL